MSLKKISETLEKQRIQIEEISVRLFDEIEKMAIDSKETRIKTLFSNTLLVDIEKSNRGILSAIKKLNKNDSNEKGDDLERRREEKSYNERLLKAIAGVEQGAKKGGTVKEKGGGFRQTAGAGIGAGVGIAAKGLGMAAGLGALGVGIGAFFTGLAIGDKLQALIDTDMSATKKNMITLGEAFAETPTEGLLKMGAVALIGAKFGSLKGALKMGLFGAGLSAFFGGLALGDKGMSMLNTDGSSLAKIMTSLGQGLNAFDAKSLVALGGLLALGTAFGSAAAIGLPLFGVGLAGFLAALVGVTDIMAALGADGSGLKDILTNMATGLGALAGIDGENLSSVAKGMGAVGLGMVALMGAKGISKVIDFVTGLFGSSDDDDVFTQVYKGLQPLSTLNANNLNGLNDISKVISGLTGSLENLSDVDYDDVEDSIKDLGKTLAFTIPMLEAAKKGGEFGQGFFDGYPSLDFGSGLDSISPEDLNKISKISSISKIIPTQAPQIKEITDQNSELMQQASMGNTVIAPVNNSSSSNNSTTNLVSQIVSSHDTQDPYLKFI